MNETVSGFFGKAKSHVLVGLILFSLCWLTYGNGLHNGFGIDDHPLITANPQIRNAGNFGLNFAPPELPGRKNVYYRPIPHALIMLNYLAFGNDPFGYHLVNLVLFSLAAFSLYAFLLVLFSDGPVAILAAALFCVHPINGMLINYITATGYSLMLIATFLSLISFWYSLDKRNAGAFLAASLFFFLIALLCHEVMMIFPLYLAAVLFMARRLNAREVAVKCLPYILVIVGYFILRLQFASLKSGILDKISIFHLTFPEYLATFGRIVAWYFEKLATLKGIVLIWVSPVIREGAGLLSLLLLVVISAALSLSLFFWRRDARGLGVAWIIINFIPVSLACLYQPTIGFMIEPHWLIFASIGFFVLIAYWLVQFFRKWNRAIGVILMAAFLTINILQSQHYNELWRSPKSYCRYWLSVVPGFKSAIFYLADAYLSDGETDTAARLYRQALSGQEDDSQIYTNLGLIAAKNGDLKAAAENYNIALQYDPKSAATYNDLGVVYLKTGNTVGASEVFLKTLAINSFLIEPRLNLARIASDQNDSVTAARLYAESLSIDPNDEVSLYELAAMHLKAGDKKRAAALAQRLLRVGLSPERLVNMGSQFASHNLANAAMPFYVRAIKLDQNCREAYLELGKLYGNFNQFNRAIRVWQEGLEIDPPDPRFVDLIRQAKTLRLEAKSK